MRDMFGVDKCPVCGSSQFVYNRRTGEVICKKCGYVIKIVNIDMGPEWRQFQGDEVNKSRVGLPHSPLIADRGVGTVLGNIQSPPSERGYKVSESRRREIQRIKTWVKRVTSSDSQERNLKIAFDALQKLGEKLDIPKHILERAAEIYRKALEKDLVRGRAINSIVAASLYLALRESQNPRTLKSIAKAARISKKELGRCYRLLIKELKIKPPLIDPAIYVRSIVARAKLHGDVWILAEKIIRLAKNRRVTVGKDSIGLATAAVYYAALIKGYKINQRDMVKASDVTEVTIRNRCKSLMDDLGFSNIGELEDMLEKEAGEHG